MLPVLLKTSFITIYSYPFVMGIAWALAYQLTAFLFEKNKYSIKHLGKYFIGLFVSSFLGAKIVFLLVSAGDMFDSYTASASFWLGGGFVFYGGLIGGLIWSYLSIFLFKFAELQTQKYLIPGLVFGHALGRVGCFLAGCCYGHELESGGHFPIQLVESGLLVFLGVYIVKNLHKQKIVTIYLISYSLLRFVLEFYRSDEIRGLLPLGLSTSQYISIIFFTFAVLEASQNRKASLKT